MIVPSWLSRYLVKRLAWWALGAAVVLLLGLSGIAEAASQPGGRPVPVSPATHCDGITTDEGTEPCPTPTPTPTPEPTLTPSPEPTPMVVELSGDDRDRLDAMYDQGWMVAGLLGFFLAALLAVTGLRR